MKHKVACIALFTLVALLGSALFAEAKGSRFSFGFGIGNRGYYAPYGYYSPGYYPFGTYRYYSPFGTYRSYYPFGTYQQYYPFGTYQQYYPFGSYSVPYYGSGPVMRYRLEPYEPRGYRGYTPRRGDGRNYGSYVPRRYYRRTD